jgi:hypothetical protein
MCVCVRAFPSDCISIGLHFHRIAFPRACVFDVRVSVVNVCAPRCCARTLVARRGLAVFIARPALRARSGSRVGRRNHVDKPHDQRAMGCASSAHDRDRRRRRHLRHRRPKLRHQLPGRVREHRRRCAGRTKSRGTGWVLRGYYRSVPRGYYRGTQGTQGVLQGVVQGYLAIPSCTPGY